MDVMREVIEEREVTAHVTYVDGREGDLRVRAALYSDRTALYRPADGRSWDQVEGLVELRLPLAFPDVWE